MNYTESLEWLYSLKPEGGLKRENLGLEKINQLLYLLGNPHEQFKSIHVAGTSGKGSTAYFISAILREVGYKVGLHVSPHLQTANERIQINSELISNENFGKMAGEVKEAIDSQEWPGGQPSFFEATVAMAFLHFAQEKVDFAIVEVGLGGKLDATNVLKPLVSIITSISLDHQEVLGNGIEKIAGNKAGIIKKETPVIVNNSLPREAFQVIEQTTEEKNATVINSQKCKLREVNFNVMKFTGEFSGRQIELETRASGLFQLENAGHALKIAELLTLRGYKISETAIANGFRSVSIPCRFETMQEQPLVILDGAHNPAKVAALVETLQVLKAKPDFLVGILKAKPAGEIINLLRPVARSFTFIQPQLAKNFHSTRELQEITDARGIETQAISESEKELFQFIKNYKGKLLCVTGSLYLAGMARNYWLPAIKQ